VEFRFHRSARPGNSARLPRPFGTEIGRRKLYEKTEINKIDLSGADLSNAHLRIPLFSLLHLSAFLRPEADFPSSNLIQRIVPRFSFFYPLLFISFPSSFIHFPEESFRLASLASFTTSSVEFLEEVLFHLFASDFILITTSMTH